MIRQKYDESDKNFYERLKLEQMNIRSDMSVDDYKKRLDLNSLNYIEINATKSNGKKISMCIPTCQFNVISKRKLLRLISSLKGI